MANNDYITTDCKLTVSKNTAKLDEEIFLYKNDRNIKLLIEIVDNKYRYKSDDLSNLLVKYKASYAQVKWYKNAEVKKEFPIQATDDGKVVFVIEGELINEDTELGDYDLQLRLLNESQESIRSLPIIKGAVHILKPLFEEGDIATVNSAIADVSMLSLGGDAIDTYNNDGTYNQTNWGSGDIISSSKLNKLEKVAKDNVDKVNKMPAKSIVEGGKLYLAKEDGTKLDAGTALPAGGSGSTIEVINNLESDSTTAALSAAQGKVLNTQYKDLASKIGTGVTNNSVEPQLMDIPRIYFSEGTLPTSKTATVMKFDYYSKTAAYHGYVDIKCQGNSSMSYPKKNFTIKPYKDKDKTTKLKIDFKGWGKQSKFVLKANWIDLTHARNVVSARLWGDVIKTRSDYVTAIPELLRTSPNQGAIDGFPVLVYSNGVYQGRYTLNIPKDKWMSNMDDALDTHCILCGENYVSGCFRALPAINGGDWTDELHDVVPATIKTSWTNAIKFVMNSTDTEFKANLGNYFDVNSLIDYLLYGIVCTNLDGFGKNQIYFTYDGVHWIASVYDLDSTWGLWWNGSQFVATNYAREDFQDLKPEGGVTKQGNLLYMRLQQLFIPQLKKRYAELRKDVLSVSHIIQKFEEFNEVCPKDTVQEDYASTTGEGKFTGIPSKTTNNIQQLRSYINARLTYVDGYINALQEAIACTNITLNNTTLSFTTDAAQTLTATVTPTDTTDTVVWSVSPTGFATVDNGVVTPIKNGTCVITATCGTKSATCNVTVSDITEQPDVVYSLATATTFNGTSDFIDTGVKLFDTAKDFTIYIDFAEGTGNKNNNSVFHCIYEQPPYRGLCLNYGAVKNAYFLGGYDITKANNPYLDNINTGKYLIEFKNGVISRAFSSTGELTINNEAKTNSPYSKHDKNLLLGCYQTTDGTKGRYWNGTINKFNVWFRTLSATEITTLMGGIKQNLLEGVTWSAEANNGIIIHSSDGVIGQEKGAGNGDAYLSEQIPCEKKKYVLSNINGATFIYKEIYAYTSDGTFIDYSHSGDGNMSGDSGKVTPSYLDLTQYSQTPAYLRITVFPNHVASNNSPATQLKLVAEN